MRFNDIETIFFKAADGKTYPIKPIKDIQEFTQVIDVEIEDGETADQVAVRIYGAGREADAWKIIEANIIKIIENNMTMEGLKVIKVPI